MKTSVSQACHLKDIISHINKCCVVIKQKGVSSNGLVVDKDRKVVDPKPTPERFFKLEVLKRCRGYAAGHTST